MKFATILSIVFIAVPTLAISAEQYERSYNVAESDLYDREVDESVDYLTREDLNDILGRELVDEIDERSPFGIFTAVKAAFRVGKLVNNAVQSRKHKRDLEFDYDLEMREDLNDIFGREVVDEIDERSPFGIFTAIKAAFRVGKVINHAVQARKHKRELEFDEGLEMREPIKAGTAMRLFRGADKVANHAEQAHAIYQQHKGNQPREVLEEREVDGEVFEREFDEEYFEREFDDLD